MASELEPPELLATLASAGFDIVDGDPIPIFNAGSIAAALVDRSGRVLSASPAFIAMGAGARIDPDLVRRACGGAGPVTAVVEMAPPGGAEDTAIFAYGSWAQATAWRLPPDIRDAGAPGHAVILSSQTMGAAKPLEEACRSYGLNGLQTRVALETIRAGGAKAAARALGISVHTARDALAEAMARVHAPRLSVLVARLTSLAFGVMPDADSAGVLADLWGLTPRQAAIAGLVADGLSRRSVAGALSLSEAVVRKELEQIHQLLQVSSGAALARKVVEANALRWLTRATGGDIGFVEASAEPLQFVPRPDGSRIAVSDYGPASGAPVLVVHSSLSSRIVARRLVRALHAAGYRPISIDRPGFGLTDEVAGLKAGAHDPYATATGDALLVFERLKVRTLDVVARGGAQFVLALAKAAPDRLGRVVLVNPDPDSNSGPRTPGLYGAMKEAYRRNPAIIQLSVALVAQQLSYERYRQAMSRSMRGSPPDEAAARDPEIVRDRFRGQRVFATGRYEGLVNEQTDFALASRPPPLAGTRTWRVLVGAHDTLHDPRHVLDYWREVLPDAEFQLVGDAGRLLAISHPHHVVEALRRPGR